MTLYSLNAFRLAKLEGRSHTNAIRFARNVAEEMAEDGELAHAEGFVAEAPVEVAATAVHTRENPHPDVHDYGGPYNYSVGSKYDKSLDIAAIAKRVRADIKEAVKAKALPAGKYGVTISRYSGGRSLNVKVRGLPEGFVLLNPERVKREAANPHEFIPDSHCPRYTAEGKAMLTLLERIASAYNYDRSDTMTDFFSVNYYCHVDVDWELEKRLRESMPVT